MPWHYDMGKLFSYKVICVELSIFLLYICIKPNVHVVCIAFVDITLLRMPG